MSSADGGADGPEPGMWAPTGVSIDTAFGGHFVVRVVESMYALEDGDLEQIDERTDPGRFCFVNLQTGRIPADTVRGEFGYDVDGIPISYVGHGFQNRHFQSKPLDQLPEVVIRELVEQGFVLVDGVDGGWVEWTGRPEHSTSYLDLRDARPASIAGAY